MRRFTSRFPKFDATNSDCVAIEKVRKTAFFGPFYAATQVIMVGLKIGEREVKLRMILRLLCIHYFAVSSIAKYLMPRKFPKVWWGVVNFAKRNRGTAAVRTVVNTRCENVRGGVGRVRKETV